MKDSSVILGMGSQALSLLYVAMKLGRVNSCSKLSASFQLLQ